MFYASDNAGPVHPKVMAALERANAGHAMPYGACDWTAAAVALLREVFEAPEAGVHLVPTGTSANALALSSLTEPWRRTFCSDIAHVHEDEMGACSFYSGGAELGLVPQTDGRMAPADLAARIDGEDADRHGPVTVTQVTERGTVYPLETLAALAGVAQARGLPVHMDGARFANAVAALGCTAAEMTRGIAAVSFGGTKNGCMGVEAVVRLDPEAGASLPHRRQRGGHTFSKHRYLAAQLVGYLEDGTWLETAAQANAKAARLAAALAAHPDVEVLHPVEANMIFARWPRALHDRLQGAGAVYYTYPAGPDDARPMARLVCDWSVDDGETDNFLNILQAG